MGPISVESEAISHCRFVSAAKDSSHVSDAREFASSTARLINLPRFSCDKDHTRV